jgi:lysophospholipase L1-like esterase
MKYLALGDSYTIGESLPYHENFPSQVVKLLNEKNVHVELEKLIALTGWTTDELAVGIYNQNPHRSFDWVTLLIGVNNQYRERSVEEYESQFYSLLCQAILFANGKSNRVIVLSIPDWGLTPFNTTKDKQIVSQQIDEYNLANKQISLHAGCHYLNVTESTREHATDLNYLATDQLHYSATEYKIWATEIAKIIEKAI